MIESQISSAKLHLKKLEEYIEHHTLALEHLKPMVPIYKNKIEYLETLAKEKSKPPQ